jgi:hypothetical protein
VDREAKLLRLDGTRNSYYPYTPEAQEHRAFPLESGTYRDEKMENLEYTDYNSGFPYGDYRVSDLRGDLNLKYWKLKRIIDCIGRDSDISRITIGGRK